jgi:hypothetical protein
MVIIVIIILSKTTIILIVIIDTYSHHLQSKMILTIVILTSTSLTICPKQYYHNKTQTATAVRTSPVSSTAAVPFYRRNISAVIEGHQYVTCGRSWKKQPTEFGRPS